MIPELENQAEEVARAFNSNPKAGIKRIMSICQETNVEPSVQIAEFFKAQKNNLNLTEVGDYLGAEGTLNNKVRVYFMEIMSFKDQEFIPAIRDFLQEFKLPGEAQKIDRLIEGFATKYTQDNPKNDINKDAYYLLAFQTIMLNTDLHNPSIRSDKKMTMDGFKRNLRGCNDGQDFPEAILKGIYTEIKSKPFKFNFSEKIPGYELRSSDLAKDKMYKAFCNGHQDIKNLLEKSELSNIEIADKTTKSWWSKKTSQLLSGITGLTSEVIVTDTNGARANIQLYKPSIFSIFNKTEPSVIVKPIVEEGKQATKESLELASKIAASFGPVPKSIEATYDYEKKDLERTYSEAKAVVSARNITNSKKSHVERELERRANNNEQSQIRS
jgi:guanine nucleotide exchange protein RalF